MVWHRRDEAAWRFRDAGRRPDNTPHPIHRTRQSGEVLLPIALDPGIDLKRTTYLSRMIQRWGKLPLMLLNSMDLKGHRYAYIGTEDWRMHPLISPGSLVLIDETKRKILKFGMDE